jgi:ribosomal protein S18 acetylase RimI-like enzyme
VDASPDPAPAVPGPGEEPLHSGPFGPGQGVPASPGPHIRPWTPGDDDALWAILEAVFATGETYAYPPGISREEALERWTAPPARAWVAERDGRVVGSSRVMPNQPGLGSHVANGSFVVDPGMGGGGIGRALGRHALRAAAELGYRAMQFNLVVSTNTRAIALWESLGFATVGRLPGAFLLRGTEEVDALVMFRRLDPSDGDAGPGA